MAVIYNPDLVSSPFEAGAGTQAFKGPERVTFPSPGSSSTVKGPAESKFEDALKEMVSRVNETQNSADASVAKLASGQSPDIHSTMIELEQAEISLRMAMQVRSKVIDAYHEIMRMSV